MLTAIGPAQAYPAPSGTLTAGFATTAAVGHAAPVTVTGFNITSTPVTVSRVTVLPSCGGTVILQPKLGCSVADVGVFRIVPDPTAALTGACGRATGFTVGAADARGIVTLTPTGGTLTVPAGGTCTAHLRETALRLPRTDVDPTRPGVQTNTGAGAVGGAAGGTATAIEIDTAGNPTTVTG